jgi:TonB family protein
LVEEKTGALATRDGLRLKLVTDLGNVHISTNGSGQVSYRVRLETDSREPEAQNLLRPYVLTARTSPAGVELTGQAPWHNFRGRLWVNFEVSVPRNYNLHVLTQAGNVETQDIDGRVSLVTSGGNITAGRVGGPEAAGARLETQGGHITVEDANGDLRAFTAGGHISAANVQGDAVLRSGGGHIRAGTIRGTAQLETEGGNISVQRAGADVTATTGGGQIDFGEAAGSIRARNGSGGIRILRVVGPTQLETSGGSIFLTKVQGTVHASTAAGTITAWLTPDGKLFEASQLESGQGDIAVYLPRELPVNIEATIEMADNHRIDADPSFPLKLSYLDSGAGGRAVRGECALNGGGQVLRLKTVAGDIRLKFSDTEPQIRLNQQQMEQLRRRLELQQQRLLEHLRQHGQQLQAQIEQQVQHIEKQLQQAEGPGGEAGRLEEWARRLEEIWWGSLRVDADRQQQKLVHSVRPVYPDAAKQAGIEGTVRLKATIAKDGTVQDLKVLSGDPALVNAAVEAVRQWRYQPTLLEGRPVSVITTVTVEFRLK